MTQTPFYQDNTWWIEIAVGHDPGWPKKKRTALSEEKGDDGGEDSKVDYSSPNFQWDSPPSDAWKLVPTKQEKPATACDQNPEGHQGHGFFLMEEFDKRRIKGHEQAADKKDQVTGVEIKGQKFGEVTVK